MSQPAHIAERHARILGDLAERGHSLACKLHDGAMAAEDPESCARIAAGFHQVARTVRQTLALEAKLERDARRAEREVAPFGPGDSAAVTGQTSITLSPTGEDEAEVMVFDLIAPG